MSVATTVTSNNKQKIEKMLQYFKKAVLMYVSVFGYGGVWWINSRHINMYMMNSLNPFLVYNCRRMTGFRFPLKMIRSFQFCLDINCARLCLSSSVCDCTHRHFSSAMSISPLVSMVNASS